MRSGQQSGDGAERLFAGAVWCAMTAALAVYVVRYGSNVPFMEDWELVPVLSGHRAVSVAWLGEQILEHRYVLAKALLYPIFLASPDFRVPMYVDAVLLSGLAVAFMLGARVLRGRTSFADAFFPLVLLHWGHGGTLIFFIQLCFVLPVVLFSAVLLAIATKAWEGRPAVVAGIAVAVALLPLNGGIGMLLAPPLVAWMALAATARWREGPGGRRDAAVLAAGAVATVAIAIAYMVGLEQPAHINFVPRTPSRVIVAALEVLGMAVGPAGSFVWPASGLLVGAVFAIATACFAWVAWTRPVERLRAAGLLACMASAWALVWGIAYGRAVMGHGFGFADRYALLSALGLCCAFLGASLYGVVRGVRLGYIGQATMFACMCAVLWTNLELGHDYGVERRAAGDALLADAAAGAAPELLAERHWRPLYPNEKVMADRLVMLREVGWGPYRREAGD